jgi:hypothetical protein
MRMHQPELKPREKLVELLNTQLPDNHKLNFKEEERCRLTNKDIEIIYKAICDIKDKEPMFKVENQSIKPTSKGVNK